MNTLSCITFLIISSANTTFFSQNIKDQDFGPTKKYKLKQKTMPEALPKIQNLTFPALAKY